jgi:hypothetical protein
VTDRDPIDEVLDSHEARKTREADESRARADARAAVLGRWGAAHDLITEVFNDAANRLGARGIQATVTHGAENREVHLEITPPGRMATSGCRMAVDEATGKVVVSNTVLGNRSGGGTEEPDALTRERITEHLLAVVRGTFPS